MKRLYMAVLCTLIIGAPWGATFAADVIKPLARKKFKLHAVGIGFQTTSMSLPRTIPQLDYQKVGVVSGDLLSFEATLSPDIVLPAERYLWAGAKTGIGKTISITFLVNEFPHNESLILGAITKSVQVRIAELPGAGEAAWCILSFDICEQVLATGNEAKAWALANRASLGEGNLNGRTDAARHSYWNALLIVDGIDPGRVVDATTAHEKTNYDDGFPHNEIAMDIENNRQGSIIGGSLSLGASRSVVQTAIRNALDNGQFMILDDLPNTGERGLLQPSNR